MYLRLNGKSLFFIHTVAIQHHYIRKTKWNESNLRKRIY